MLGPATLALCLSMQTGAGAPSAPHFLERDGLRVGINEYGVVVRAPVEGLGTVDGPRMELREGFHEWYGVHFTADSGEVVAFAPGSAGDWGERVRVRFESFAGSARTATAIARAGDLEIRTDFRFESGPYLIADVTFTNRGSGTIKGLLYTRECLPGDGSAGWTFPGDIPGVLPAPESLRRHVWMLDFLRPGASAGAGVSYTLLGEPAPPPGVDVPLVLWTSADYPSGLVFGTTFGISFGDYDGDGYIDVFACDSANLWRNAGGTTWSLAADLDSVLPPASIRYGSSFGDYDDDGLADIATEPRSCCDGCIHLLHNLGAGPSFEDVATDPLIMDVQACEADSETICWGDVDGDRDLDMFFPAYPPWAAGASSGNFFYRNLGPSGPGGAYRFQEYTAAGGFFNPPPDSARPEGAQFVDVDFDGDMDLYSNGTLYQNDSTPGDPSMDWMTTAGSGIDYHEFLEEGAAFGDYDLDGDYDLFIVYTTSSLGVRIWENYGDGTFFDVEDGVIENRSIGLNLGLSAEDWDNDGDIDFTTRQVFRRNQLMETGKRRFTVATHTIPASHITSATPAWGDWDEDGDLDSALGNWAEAGRMYENTTYGPATPMDERRYVRVRPVLDSQAVPVGLETEYATTVEIDVLGETAFRRKKFTSSSAGYLNQNEYTLTFALPPDPSPATDGDISIDAIVDFPHLDGIWRVDGDVTPALSGVALADLAEREIVVFRSGRVILNGVEHLPCGVTPPLAETLAPLVSADPTTPMPGLTDIPIDGYWVGLELDTLGAQNDVMLREIVLDGQLDQAGVCGATNVWLWDVTTGLGSVVASSALTTSPRNRRSYFRFPVVLERERVYRLVAKVDSLRETPFAGPVGDGGLRIDGGFTYTMFGDCGSSTALRSAILDPTRLYVTVRHSSLPVAENHCTSTVTSSGSAATISFCGGVSVSQNEFWLRTAGAPAGEFGQFFYGPNRIQVPFGDGFRCVGGGVVRLNPPARVEGDGTATRRVDLAAPPVPAGAILPGSAWSFQYWFRDPSAGGAGFNLSDAVEVIFEE